MELSRFFYILILSAYILLKENRFVICSSNIGEENTYIYFDAKTPGFGHFVIALNNESTNTKSSGSTDDNPLSPIN